MSFQEHIKKLLIAHRGNLDGPSRFENHASFLLNALDRGFSIEIDLRYDARSLGYYLSHDLGRLNSNNSWCDFLDGVEKRLPGWKKNRTWGESLFPIPRIWVDWKEADIELSNVVLSLVKRFGIDALDFFVFIDFELVYGARTVEAFPYVYSDKIPISWRRSELDDEDDEHVKNILVLRDINRDWIWIDDLRENLLDPWWSLPGAGMNLISLGSTTPDLYAARKALVAPDLHKVSQSDSVSILKREMKRCVQDKAYWINAICSDFVCDESLQDDFTQYVKSTYEDKGD